MTALVDVMRRCRWSRVARGDISGTSLVLGTSEPNKLRPAAEMARRRASNGEPGATPGRGDDDTLFLLL